MSVPADTPADRPAGLAIEVVATLLSELADLREANEEHVRLVNGLLSDMWSAYVLTGADTDGDNEWHCEPAHAVVALMDAVGDLRGCYDEAVTEVSRLRAEVERLTAEAREHVTELNLATINSFHAGEQSKEAEGAADAVAALVAEVERLTARLALAEQSRRHEEVRANRAEATVRSLTKGTE